MSETADPLVDTWPMSGGLRWLQQFAIIVVALAASAAWVLIDHPLEGPVWVRLSYNHGIHYTDALIAAPLWWAWRTVARS
jgi:hypothetical protein